MKKPIVLNFQVAEDFLPGIRRLASVLGFTEGDGITVTAREAAVPGVTLRQGKAEIRYNRFHMFFRELGLLVQHAGEGEFDIQEDNFFEVLSVMIDTSRAGVPTVATVEKTLDYLAVMGYGMAMLYTEDTVCVENRPYFGYMRGRYSQEELRAIDDYAFTYGIEMIPCLECYGHMGKYLFWKEAAPIKDTGEVLLAREAETFRFLDDLIGTTSKCFRSRRIHIGMDEAWDMGRGAFLDKHGYVPPFQIFNEFMEELVSITRKYGLTPMMWADMYFRHSAPNGGYYEEATVIPPEVAEKIPQEMELVFWHYGEKPYCDDYMLKKFNSLGKKTIYAGGNWSWVGHFPEHHYTMDAVRFSLRACRDNNVREAMLTLWLNDNAECDLFANLFDLSFFAELCYNADATEEVLRARFEACTGGDYETFLAMSLYHNKFENGETYSHFSHRFLGKPLFWQDILDGLYDTHLFAQPMAAHYAACAQRMKNAPADRWQGLYKHACRVFDYLAVKCLVAETLWPAYQEGNRKALRNIADTLLPLLLEKTQAVHEGHRDLWLDRMKATGWCNLDIRYAGVAARCRTAKLLLDRYLAGEDAVMEELEEMRLHKGLNGFIEYSKIASPNLKT